MPWSCPLAAEIAWAVNDWMGEEVVGFWGVWDTGGGGGVIRFFLDRPHFHNQCSSLMENDMTDWDDDIKAMNLSYLEKNGLQVHRNYTKAFENEKEKKFSDAINKEANDFIDLEKIMWAICSDDKRIIPILSASFFDYALKNMFEKQIKDGVPGGKRSLFSRNGPLSTFSSRVQLAFAFGYVSDDVLIDIDHLRKI
jgi:hypothetical protein